ncbi:MAG: oxidoreductase [Proteobacteria bacterium]|nr:MAG: oxidoreductase [Pseudomonadota bacterium]
MLLEGKRALITGASAGIGAEFARQLHAAGCDVTLAARREDRLLVFAEELNALRPSSAKVVVCDLSSEDQARGLPALEKFLLESQIDILVNNAGIGSFGYFEEIPWEHEEAIIRLNVIAFTRVARAAIPQMKQRRSGAIINISSIGGFQAIPYMATYSASKAYNFNHSLSIRYELKRFGVKVLTVCPGPVQTEFFGVARVPGTATGRPRDSAEAVVRHSLRALERDQAVVIPGWRGWLMSLPCRLLPRPLTNTLSERALRSTLKAVGKA